MTAFCLQWRGGFANVGRFGGLSQPPEGYHDSDHLQSHLTRRPPGGYHLRQDAPFLKVNGSAAPLYFLLSSVWSDLFQK